MRTVDVVKTIVKALYDQTLRCVELNLYCIDPPTLTSGMLKQYGIKTDHRIENFWHVVDELLLKHARIPIYRSRNLSFDIVLIHKIDHVYKLMDRDVYVDVLECGYRKCVTVPRTHVLLSYLEGRYDEHLWLRLNLITILKILCHRIPRFRECLRAFAENPLSINNVVVLASCVQRLISYGHDLLEEFLDKIPTDLESLVRVSPILRYLVSRKLKPESD